MSSPDVQTQNVNFRKQLEQTLAGYQNTAGGFFDLSKEFAPRYTDLNLNTLAQTLFGSNNAPGTLETGATANTFGRASDIADIMRLGPAGYEALMRANPGLARSLANANAAGETALHPSALMSTLDNQAVSALRSEGRLSANDEAEANQAARAGMAARGLGQGNQSVASEILNRSSLVRGRQQQAQQFAGGVESLANTERTAGRGFLSDLARINASVYDPSQQVIGRSGTTIGGIGSNGAGVNPGSLMGTLNTSSLFNPLGGADAYFTNVNQRGAANIASANNSAAQQNAWMSIAAAALLSDERLKKDKKRVGTTKSGIPLYRFKYKDGSKQEYVGPMAQDVEKVHPKAVHEMPLTGHKIVDLRKTDAPFLKVPRLMDAMEKLAA
jgi:endosialidase-like protein